METEHTSEIIQKAIEGGSPRLVEAFRGLDETNASLAESGSGLLQYQSTANEFIEALVDRIGLVVVRTVSLTNPLAKFKKGVMPLGLSIEEIFTDLAKAQLYNPAKAETEVFKREIPDTKTLFHKMNRQEMYKQTIQDESLRTAFVSWSNFDNFLGGIINAIYNASEVDEYVYMRKILEEYHTKSLFHNIELAGNPLASADNAKDFVKKLRGVAKKMTLPMGSDKYNAMKVTTRCDMDDLHVIIDADLEAEIDVEVLARAFNMDKTNFLGNVTVIDGFAENSGLVACVIDREFFMVYDKLVKMETIRNPQGLYWNYNYHIWQILSASRFANAVSFTVKAALPASTIEVTPENFPEQTGAPIA